MQNQNIQNGVNLNTISDLDVLNALLSVQTTNLANIQAQNALKALQAQKGIDAIQARIAVVSQPTPAPAPVDPTVTP